MIIDDFNISDIVLVPLKTDSPLIIDPNAVLPGAFPFEPFQTVTRHSSYILQAFGILQVE